MPLSLGLSGGIAYGADTGAPVTPDYKAPFKFTETIHGMTVDVSGDLIRDTGAEIRKIMA
jgi:hypothetical protein